MRILQITIGLILLGLVAAGDVVRAQGESASPFDQSLSPTERLEALADRMREAHRSLETLEADFQQTKQSALLMDPDHSEGQFLYSAPDRVRWEYSLPDPISLVIADRLMTTWYRDIEQVERAQVGEQSDRVLRYLGAGTSLDELVKYFRVSMHLPPDEADPLRLELSPRFERVKKRVQGIDLWLHPTHFLPVRLKYTEGDGDVTEYEFLNLRINAGITDDRFELELPQDVRVREVRLESLDSTSDPR